VVAGFLKSNFQSHQAMNLSQLLAKPLALAVLLGSAPALLAAAITTSVSPAGPFTVGQTFTVTFSISGYAGPDEIDGYEFKITYPSALFSVVGGSESLHDGPGFGAAVNWLRKAPQDLVGAGAILTNGTTSSAGTENVSVVDLRGASVRGTTAADGFLYSFDVMANAPGVGSFTPSTPGTGIVLYDVSLSPVGPAPTFTGATVTVVPEPALLPLLAGGIAILAARRSRRRA
jgi:hypothetical protein